MVVMGDGRWKAVVYPLAGRPDADGLVLVNWAVSRAATPREPGGSRGPIYGFPGAASDWTCGDLRLRTVLAGAGSVGSFPMLDRDPLPRWSFGTVTLVGDAAHAMAPMGSNATTQAVLDARGLAHALATHRDLVRALAAYDRDRRPPMNRLQLFNRAKGPELVIDLAQERAPGGFRRVEDVIPAARLALVADARAAGFDAESAQRALPLRLSPPVVGSTRRRGPRALRPPSRSPGPAASRRGPAPTSPSHTSHRTFVSGET
ncbi:hypothetical protein STENM36S_03520 [Streptomyces tendae]